MAYIVAAVRTAGGKRAGKLSGWHPTELGAEILNNLINKTKIDPSLVDDVILGCVDQAGEQSSNIARNVVLASNLPESVPGTSIDRQCGSSQQAVHFAAQAVMSGTMDVVIAAGVESMTRVPMGLPSTLPRKNNFGFYMGPKIQQKYSGVEFSQFMGAEMMAKKYGLTREELDAFSVESHLRAIRATNNGTFNNEILPLQTRIFDPKTGTETITDDLVTVDEGIRFDISIENLAKLKPLQEGGMITPGNASQICDGASGVLIVNERGLKLLNVEPLARIHHMNIIGHDPVIMLEAPIPATAISFKKTGLRPHDIEHYEINEAFASVPLAWIKHHNVNPEHVNPYGGAIALGHPLGASGTKLMSTLVHGLINNKKKYGFQSMCEGGGMANVTIIENLRL
eukprot:CAMPEP_0174819210 /NCGR_PEP_ID=MMETSP1107-20130205/2309_1 /TAXON_ID=36770 /ORGANISM="Paraphysomonas vestita, Strain GFlagA" /LENGTH=397 /DNA_ID=CAMNT_0016032287 /DNA_START=40 /DNA_END=1233 /DNA_ORIENTATION=-